MQEVTIILPAYRHECYVAAAVESVLAQTFGGWELLIIDDCSPDGTWLEIERFSEPRISKWCHKTNLGAHATLNEGLAKAQGRYVAILNSDDVYHPQRLERLIGYLEETGADLVGSGLELIGTDGAVVVDPEHPWRRWYDPLLQTLRGGGDLIATLLAGNIFVTTSNFVFRRDLAARVGDFEDLRYAHDYAFLLGAAALPGVRIALLADEPLLRYRIHDTNTIREDLSSAFQETQELLLRSIPALVPGDALLRVEMALRHLSALGVPADVSVVARLEQELAAVRWEVAMLRDSRSFRLGQGLLWPLRALRRLGHR